MVSNANNASASNISDMNFLTERRLTPDKFVITNLFPYTNEYVNEKIEEYFKVCPLCSDWSFISNWVRSNVHPNDKDGGVLKRLVRTFRHFQRCRVMPIQLLHYFNYHFNFNHESQLSYCEYTMRLNSYPFYYVFKSFNKFYEKRIIHTLAYSINAIDNDDRAKFATFVEKRDFEGILDLMHKHKSISQQIYEWFYKIIAKHQKTYNDKIEILTDNMDLEKLKFMNIPPKRHLINDFGTKFYTFSNKTKKLYNLSDKELEKCTAQLWTYTDKDVFYRCLGCNKDNIIPVIIPDVPDLNKIYALSDESTVIRKIIINGNLHSYYEFKLYKVVDIENAIKKNISLFAYTNDGVLYCYNHSEKKNEFQNKVPDPIDIETESSLNNIDPVLPLEEPKKSIDDVVKELEELLSFIDTLRDSEPTSALLNGVSLTNEISRKLVGLIK